MDFRISIDVQACAEMVWLVLQDVERWPQWTVAITRLERIQPGALGLDRAVKIWQPGLLPATWKVTAFQEYRSFTWVSSHPGLRLTGMHRIEPDGTGTRVTLTLNITGLLAPVVGRLVRSRTQRYLHMEARGPKARSEEMQRAANKPSASA